MKTVVISYNVDEAWSGPLPAEMDSHSTLIIAFGAPEFFDHHRPFDDLSEAFPLSHFCGCSTAGEINGVFLYDHSLVVAIVQFENTRVKTSTIELADSNKSFDTASMLADQLVSSDLRSIIVLSEGLNVNGSELVRGFNSQLADGIIVTGGLAGDGNRFQRTWVILQGKPVSGYVTAIALYGDNIQVGHGSQGGWDIFGPERLVTRSVGNVLYELDGRPALDLYKEYLGELASGLPATALRFPLSLRENSDSDKKLVRTVLSTNDAENSMTFAGDVPEGYLAQLMHANMERLVEGAENAAIIAKSGDDDKTVLVIAISCVGRRIVLGEYVEEELEVTLETFPKNSQQIGFYSYGELSPYGTSKCDLHNQTMTLTTLYEI